MVDQEKFSDYFKHFDKDTVIEVIDIFLDEFDQRLKTLGKNIKERDYQAIKFNAHSFKSVISNYFSEEPFELIKRIEMKGRNREDYGIDDLYNQFENKGKQLARELRELKDTYSTTY